MSMEQRGTISIRTGNPTRGGQNNLQATDIQRPLRVKENGKESNNRGDRLCRNENCGRTFSPNTTRQTFCSNSCRLQVFRSKVSKGIRGIHEGGRDTICETKGRNETIMEYNNEETILTPFEQGIQGIQSGNVTNETNMITQETLNLILAERDARHSAELEKLKAQLKLEAMESRLLKLEEASEKDDSEEGIGGFKMSDILGLVATYLSQQQTTTK